MDDEKKLINPLLGVNPALGVAFKSTPEIPEESKEEEISTDDEFASGHHRQRCERKRDWDKERRKRKAAKIARRRNR